MKSGTTMALVEQALLEQLLEKIDRMQKQLERLQPEFEGVIDNNRFLKLMGVSARTASTWRAEGKIGFIQEGKKIYYRRRDIEVFLESRFREPYALQRTKREFAKLEKL